jgi:hypothetical protein
MLHVCARFSKLVVYIFSVDRAENKCILSPFHRFYFSGIFEVYSVGYIYIVRCKAVSSERDFSTHLTVPQNLKELSKKYFLLFEIYCNSEYTSFLMYDYFIVVIKSRGRLFQLQMVSSRDSN